MTPVERGDRARHLLADPVLQQAFTDTREGLVEKLEQAGIDDVTTHHEVAITLQLLKRLKTQLEKYGEAVTVHQAKRRNEAWISKMRESVAKWR